MEQVIFCALSSLQVELYNNYLQSKASVFLSGSQSAALTCITALKKLCNHPNLIYRKPNNTNSTEKNNDSDGDEDTTLEDFVNAHEYFPEDHDPSQYQPQLSGKMQVLDELLKGIKRETSDRVVLVSNSTKISFF